MEIQETSRMAWLAIQDTLPEKRRKVLNEILLCPATSWEIERALGWSHQSVSSKIRQLFLMGLIEKYRTPAMTRKNPDSGHECYVWAPVDNPQDIKPKDKKKTVMAWGLLTQSGGVPTFLTLKRVDNNQIMFKITYDVQ